MIMGFWCRKRENMTSDYKNISLTKFKDGGYWKRMPSYINRIRHLKSSQNRNILVEISKNIVTISIYSKFKDPRGFEGHFGGICISIFSKIKSYLVLYEARKLYKKKSKFYWL